MTEPEDGNGVALGQLLYRAHQLARAEANDAMRDQGIELRDVGILQTLAAHPGLSQQEVGERLGIDKSAMVRLLDGLEAQGLLHRQRRAGDRRVHQVEITAEGRERLAAASALADAALWRRAASLTPTEISTLGELLSRFLRGPAAG